MTAACANGTVFFLLLSFYHPTATQLATTDAFVRTVCGFGLKIARLELRVCKYVVKILKTHQRSVGGTGIKNTFLAGSFYISLHYCCVLGAVRTLAI